jgi:hypothetical protein
MFNYYLNLRHISCTTLLISKRFTCSLELVLKYLSGVKTVLKKWKIPEEGWYTCIRDAVESSAGRRNILTGVPINEMAEEIGRFLLKFSRGHVKDGSEKSLIMLFPLVVTWLAVGEEGDRLGMVLNGIMILTAWI